MGKESKELGKCFERTSKIMLDIQRENKILSPHYKIMGIDPASIDILKDILLVHGDFKDRTGLDKHHAWIEIKGEFVYETQKESDNPIVELSEYEDNLENIRKFTLIETVILSHSEIANQCPWNAFDETTLASIQRKVYESQQGL